MKTISIVVCQFIFASLVFAQTSTAPVPADTVRPGDVDTLPHIMTAVYDVISGPPGDRDWNRLRSLFAPGARLTPIHADKDGTVMLQPLSVDGFVEHAKTYFEKQGFYEKAAANRVEQWDHIAHVWSTYESRHAQGEKPFQRGINSFQLFNDGKRWWVVSIYWEGEEAVAIPKKYLK
jgi:hypothetical protein